MWKTITAKLEIQVKIRKDMISFMKNFRRVYGRKYRSEILYEVAEISLIGELFQEEENISKEIFWNCIKRDSMCFAKLIS